MTRQIKIRVTPNAKKDEVVQEGDLLKVYVSAPASGNKANFAALLAVADYLGIRKGKVRLVKGAKSREKLIEVED